MKSTKDVQEILKKLLKESRERMGVLKAEKMQDDFEENKHFFLKMRLGEREREQDKARIHVEVE